MARDWLQIWSDRMKDKIRKRHRMSAHRNCCWPSCRDTHQSLHWGKLPWHHFLWGECRETVLGCRSRLPKMPWQNDWSELVRQENGHPRGVELLIKYSTLVLSGHAPRCLAHGSSSCKRVIDYAQYVCTRREHWWRPPPCHRFNRWPVHRFKKDQQQQKVGYLAF